MSKLNKCERMQRKELLVMFKKDGGQLFSDETFGTTVAVMPVNSEFRKHRFALVSTAFCSYQDVWSRKYGEHRVLMRMYQGQYIKMPVPDDPNGNAFTVIAEQVMMAYEYCTSY